MPDALYTRDEAVGIVTLNRPERLNAMNSGLIFHSFTKGPFTP